MNGNNVNQIFDPLEKKQTGMKYYFFGASGALLGALLGAVPWAIAVHFGWFVGWLGFLIGFLAKKGYELCGGKPGRPKIWIVCVVTVLGVLLGNVSNDFFEFGQLIHSGEIEGAAYTDIPLLYWYWASDPDVLRSVLINLGLGLLFGVLGIRSVFTEMVTEIRPQTPASDKDETPPGNE